MFDGARPCLSCCGASGLGQYITVVVALIGTVGVVVAAIFTSRATAKEAARERRDGRIAKVLPKYQQVRFCVRRLTALAEGIDMNDVGEFLVLYLRPGRESKNCAFKSGHVAKVSSVLDELEGCLSQASLQSTDVGLEKALEESLRFVVWTRVRFANSQREYALTDLEKQGLDYLKQLVEKVPTVRAELVRVFGRDL